MTLRYVPAAAAALLLALVACEGPAREGEPTRGDPAMQGEETRARSDADEGVQVIVRLRFEPPAGAAPGSEAYARALADLREDFLDGLDFPHRVLRTHDTVPLVVLVVPAAQRAALAGSPLVASVEDDRLNAPLAR